MTIPHSQITDSREVAKGDEPTHGGFTCHSCGKKVPEGYVHWCALGDMRIRRDD